MNDFESKYILMGILIGFLFFYLFKVLVIDTRKMKAHYFRVYIMWLCDVRKNFPALDSDTDSDYFIALEAKLPSSTKIVWSFKPIKFKSYFTEEEINRLTLNNLNKEIMSDYL